MSFVRVMLYMYACMYVCMYVCRLHCPSSGYNAICQGTLPCLQDYITLIQGTMLFVRYSSVHSRLQDPSSGYNVVLQGTLPCLQGYITLVQGTMPFVRVMLYVYACMYVCMSAALPFFRGHLSWYIALSRLHYPYSRYSQIHFRAFKATGPFFRVQCSSSGYIALPSRLHYPSSGSCHQGYITLVQGIQCHSSG